MVAVYRAPAGKHLVVPVIQLDREPDLQYRVAGDHGFWHALGKFHVGEGGSDHLLDAF